MSSKNILLQTVSLQSPDDLKIVILEEDFPIVQEEVMSELTDIFRITTYALCFALMAYQIYVAYVMVTVNGSTILFAAVWSLFWLFVPIWSVCFCFLPDYRIWVC